MVSDMAANSLPLDGSVVKMKGLPFKATVEDVMKFYQGFTLKTDSIYLKRHPDGRPNGEVRLTAVLCDIRLTAHYRSYVCIYIISGKCVANKMRLSNPRQW